MNFDDFLEHKRLIESGIVDSQEAQKIFEWMDRTDRLDEGFFGDVWSWIKKNFSPTARKIYALADEYEKELKEELRAEWGNIKDKSLASKFRRGSWMKLSKDIEDRIDIIAGDDTDYRELARTIINKKTLQVKKALLIELAGQLDPEFVKSTGNDLDEEIDNLTSEEKRRIKKEIGEVDFSKLTIDIRKKIKADRHLFSKVSFKDTDEISRFIGLMILYVQKISTQDKSVKVDEQTVYKYAKEYVKVVDDIMGNISAKFKDIDNDDILAVIKKCVNRLMREKKLFSFDKIKNDATKCAIEILKDEDEQSEKTDKDEDDDKDKDITKDDLSKPIITRNTDKVLDDDEIETGIENAKEETGKEKPKLKNLSTIINERVNSFFEKEIESIVEQLKDDVEEFNDKDDDERLKFKDKYNLNSDNKLDIPSKEDVKKLISDFITIVGKLVLYYSLTEETSKQAITMTLEFIFNIYAVKKSINDKLSNENIDNILKLIVG